MKPLLIFGGFAENFGNVLKKQLFATILNILYILPDHFGILWVFHSDPQFIPRNPRFINIDDFDFIFFGFFFFRLPGN